MATSNEREERLANFKLLLGKEITNSPSPFMNWLKPTLIAAEKGSINCSYIIRKEMTNPHGILHGGVTAGIIDDLIGATVYVLGLVGQFTTINNHIDYFATAVEGDVVTAKTEVVKQGKNIINLQCEVFLERKQRLIAKGCSNMMRVDG